MNTEQLRKFCLSLPNATEDLKWENDLCFCVGTKMFASTGLEAAENNPVSFKCTPERFVELAEIDGNHPRRIESAHQKLVSFGLGETAEQNKEQPTSIMIIAIDGPSGAGKATLGKMLTNI